AGVRAGSGRVVRSARRGRAGARAGLAGAADRRQQPQPAHVRDLAGNHAVIAGANGIRPHHGGRVRHPHARRRGAVARGRRAGVPGRRSVHAGGKPRQRIAAAVRHRLIAMSSDETPAPALSPDPASARVVLFDFDGVLMHGDAFALFARDRYAHSLGCKLMALLFAPGLILLLPFSRNWPLRLLARIALLGMSERTYRRKAEAFA